MNILTNILHGKSWAYSFCYAFPIAKSPKNHYFCSFELDPCLFRILILHGKWENEKSKNTFLCQIQLLRGKCFWKCKKFVSLAELKFLMEKIWFSQIRISSKKNIWNSVLTIFFIGFGWNLNLMLTLM